MVIPSTAAPRRPLKRSTMPLVSCRWSHAVGLRCAGAGVAMLGAEGGEGRGEAPAVIGQHGRETEAGSRGLAREGDGALLGLVVLDREVDGARAPVEGDVSRATQRERLRRSPSLVCGLGQCLLSMGRKPRSSRSSSRTMPWPLAGRSAAGLGLRLRPAALKAPDVVATELRQEGANDAGEVVKRDVGRPPQGASRRRRIPPHALPRSPAMAAGVAGRSGRGNPKHRAGATCARSRR